MEIHAIYNNGIALYTNLEELRTKGISANFINSRETVEMIKEGFNQIGISIPGAVEVEAYINGKTVLIFAYLCSLTETAACIFLFENFENLISAVHSINQMPSASLFKWQDKYYLVIHSPCEGCKLSPLSEYGHSLSPGEITLPFLKEHGHDIAKGDAINILRRAFRPIPCAFTF